MDPHQASAPLSAADQARLDTFAVEIAEDALGAFQEEGGGQLAYRPGPRHNHPSRRTVVRLPLRRGWARDYLPYQAPAPD